MEFFNFLKILSMNLEVVSIYQAETVFFGTESIISLEAKLWNMVPQNIKSSESLNVFKSKIKYWTANHCPCRFAKPTSAKLVL